LAGGLYFSVMLVSYTNDFFFYFKMLGIKETSNSKHPSEF